MGRDKVKNVGLCLNRMEYGREWDDWYKPRDYYGRASVLAKNYCKAHPDADKDVVYMAASEVAEVYDLGGTKTKAKFSTAVEVKIRTALLEHRKRVGQKESEKMITREEKEQMCKDIKAGMTRKQLAEKYFISEKTVEYHVCDLRKKGLIPPATGKGGKKKAPEAAPAEEIVKIPGQIELEAEDVWCKAPKNTIGSGIFAPNVWDALSAEMASALCNALGSGTNVVARSYLEGKAKVKVRTADGKTYEMRVKEVRVHED